ncbi:uncharacterized protein LOC100889924 [Strongylocentrotus purpuratus]|uniref:Uncharacterized protein n=1 Tax=Strongylocentrotus purpuratus TaxID=7668 RepID=A0A7M7LP40_STRPU|nr:uncharacterized protein LOC100889924 [Strongylocentrotus purpuratus]|eukprot:XP_003724581.1 PREDICTED: uncharacterized protein LOC100889924 [Strongylocentrotus purpuratus]
MSTKLYGVHFRPHRLPRRVSSIYFGAVYSPPGNANECDLIQYLIRSVDIIKTAHPYAGVVILGDLNRMDISQILSGCHMKQVVRTPTRGNAILDQIISNLDLFYQEPSLLSPIGLADHNIVIWLPKEVNNRPRNKAKKRIVRPMKDSDIRAFGEWITHNDWRDVLAESQPQAMCDHFYQTLQSKVDVHFPTKSIKLHPTDKPWITPRTKELINQRQIAFSNNSQGAWKSLRKQVLREISRAKRFFYRDRIQNLKSDNPSSWYKNIKVMSGHSNSQADIIRVPTVEDNDPVKIATAINEFFANVNVDIPELHLRDLPSYLPAQTPPPHVQPWEVMSELKKIKPGKSSGPDGIPGRLVREFACELSIPLSGILNASYQHNKVPTQWKQAIIVPIPKGPTSATLDKLRPISLTDHFSKIAELFITKLLLRDINPHLDKHQYGSRPSLSTTICIVDLINYLAKSAEKPRNCHYRSMHRLQQGIRSGQPHYRD